MNFNLLARSDRLEGGDSKQSLLFAKLPRAPLCFLPLRCSARFSRKKSVVCAMQPHSDAEVGHAGSRRRLLLEAIPLSDHARHEGHPLGVRPNRGEGTESDKGRANGFGVAAACSTTRTYWPLCGGWALGICVRCRWPAKPCTLLRRTRSCGRGFASNKRASGATNAHVPQIRATLTWRIAICALRERGNARP